MADDRNARLLEKAAQIGHASRVAAADDAQLIRLAAVGNLMRLSCCIAVAFPI